MIDKQLIEELKTLIGVGTSVAEELLILSGGDVSLAATASKESRGLDQCKANIIDRRVSAIEDKLG